MIMKTELPTFKKTPRPSGLADVAFTPSTDVKLNGKLCGALRAPNRDASWSVSIIVRCDEHPGWRWLRFKRRHADEAAARAWLLDNWQIIREKHEIHSLN